MALESKSKSGISSYLTEVATDRMGLSPRKDAADKIAELILDWKEYFEDPERLG